MKTAVKKKKPRPRLKTPIVSLTPQQKALMALATPNTHLSTQLIERFCNLVRKGLAASVACDYLGIWGQTFHKWIAAGIRFQESQDPSLVLEGLLLKEYRKAQAEYLRSRQKLLHKEDNKLFYREIVILERRDKRNWGKAEPIVSDAEVVQPDERYL